MGAEPRPVAPEPERAVLVGVDLGGSAWPLDESLSELGRLAETDGAVVVGTLTQRLERPSARTFIGSGKAEELAGLVRSLDADVVIFDDELTPSQQVNLEKALGRDVKVIDRTALILDIFGRHATTRDGRLQVQLAQLNYLLPRLRGMWSHLVGEQTRGGIGSRFGQGESQLEVDRRLVRKRISRLQEELRRLDTRRSTQSKARWDSGVFRVALAGYTNAGKSTLLNRLTSSDVYVRDELFATLDPTTRSLELSEGRKVTVTDTVGFIQKLPTLLVDSFKSTLAEVSNADLVLKVVDAHDPNASKEIAAVEDVLSQIGADKIPSLVVYNKLDLLSPEELAEMRAEHPGAAFVSALDGRGIDALLHAVASMASQGDETVTALIPYEKGMLVRMVHESCQVIHEDYRQDGLLVTVRAPKRVSESLKAYPADAAKAPRHADVPDASAATDTESQAE
jgi:GTP-binding protein HflX